MASLEDFIRRQRYKGATLAEKLSLIPPAFNACVDFLRDPKRFPNRDINAISALMWDLVGHQDVPTLLDKIGLDLPGFVTAEQGITVFAFISIPLNFPELVNDNPAQMLGTLAYLGSESRDHYTGKLRSEPEAVILRRANMYEAETLLTLESMGRKEGVRLVWSPDQQEILSRFPLGIESAPELNYRTPPYLRPRGFG